MVPNNHASGSTEIIGIKPLKLPADYVDQAETIIVGFSSSKKEGCISTSKRYMEALVAYHRFYHLDKEEKE